MAKVESLGIKRLESVHYYVHDLERSRRFYTEVMDFAEIGEQLRGADASAGGRSRSPSWPATASSSASRPRGEGGRAWRYLRKHPDGVGTLNFEVEDVDEGVPPARGARRHAHRRHPPRQGRARRRVAFFSITTPFGDTTFRFIERHGYRALFPGFVAYDKPRGGQNRLGFVGFDHITSNFQTMATLALARARAGLRALLGDPVPHHRRRPRARSTARACARS